MKTVLSILIVTFAFSLSVYGAAFNVNTTADTVDANIGDGVCADSSGSCSFRAAITESNALAGTDTINIPPGFYTQSQLATSNEDGNVNGDWDILDSVTINGQPILDPQNPQLVVLQAANSPTAAVERVLHIVNTTSVVTINSVLIRFGRREGPAGNDTAGGGIRNLGTLTLNNSAVNDNTAPEGGGIHNRGSIALNNVSVQDNDCVSVTSSFLCQGGGMFNNVSSGATITIDNSFFINNTSTAVGTIAGASGLAGGLGVQGGNFTLSISNSIFSGNQANSTGSGQGQGGGMRISVTGNGTINIINTAVQFNNVSGGVARQGAGIAMVAIESGVISATLDKVRFDRNFGTEASGVGMYVGGFTNGGSISLNVKNSTFSGNHSGSSGGGIYLTSNDNALAANFSNTTISGNTVSATGGAVAIFPSNVISNFDYCTLTNNSAGIFGGGIYRQGTGGAVNLRTSVISGNTGPTGPDISGTVNSLDYNHLGNTAGATIAGTTANNSSGNAGLGALAGNGGPTQTHRPGAGSILINSIPNGTAGCGTTITADQRGLPRPNDGAACDKGSVEVNSGPYDISGTVKTSGGMPIRNAVVVLEGGNLPQPIYYLTGNFGIYQFFDLAPGQYTVSISSKRFTFAPRELNLQQDEPSIDLVAAPEGRTSRTDFEIIPRPMSKR